MEKVDVLGKRQEKIFIGKGISQILTRKKWSLMVAGQFQSHRKRDIEVLHKPVNFHFRGFQEEMKSGGKEGEGVEGDIIEIYRFRQFRKKDFIVLFLKISPLFCGDNIVVVFHNEKL